MRYIAAAALGAYAMFALFLWERVTFMGALLDPGVCTGTPEGSFLLLEGGRRIPLIDATADVMEWDA